jgi:hypothetical protein
MPWRKRKSDKVEVKRRGALPMLPLLFDFALQRPG